MAKLNKLEQARRDAMDYAYRLVKKEGLEALEKRVDRNRKTIAPAFVSDKAMGDFTAEVKANCMITFTCALAVLGIAAVIVFEIRERKERKDKHE